MKKVRFLVIMLALVLVVGMFAACGESGDVPEVAQGETLYVYEAEDTYLGDLSGVAYSGNYPGYRMVRGLNSSSIAENKSVIDSISGGYFVSYLNAVGLTLTFELESDSDSSDNQLYIRMGSEFGTLKINPENIEVRVNGEAITYEEFNVKGEAGGVYKTKFADHALGNIDLKKGSNIIEVEILSTTDYGLQGTEGTAYGPGIDCIKIVSSSTLTWDKTFEDYKDQISYD